MVFISYNEIACSEIPQKYKKQVHGPQHLHEKHFLAENKLEQVYDYTSMLVKILKNQYL